MANDRTGSSLSIGDIVFIPAKVVEVQEDTAEQHNNIAVETVHPPLGGGSPNRILVSGAQIEKKGGVDFSAFDAPSVEPLPDSEPEPAIEEEPLDGEDIANILAGTVVNVEDNIDGISSVNHLQQLKVAELGNKNRKSVLIAIDARIAEL